MSNIFNRTDRHPDNVSLQEQVLVDYESTRPRSMLTITKCTLTGTATIRYSENVAIADTTLFAGSVQHGGSVHLTACRQGFGRAISIDHVKAVTVVDCRLAGSLSLSGIPKVIVRESTLGCLQLYNCSEAVVGDNCGIGALKLDGCSSVQVNSSWIGKLAMTDCLLAQFKGGVVINS